MSAQLHAQSNRNHSDGINFHSSSASTLNQPEMMKKWGMLVAKAWFDDNFKQRLLDDPEATLKEYGMNAPEGVAIKVVDNAGFENSDEVIYLTLPQKPAVEFTDLTPISSKGAADQRHTIMTQFSASYCYSN
ncbi:MAG TPA: NHLP leader peptide family RiPP precursor [Pyrinomonadaceae bacterium]|nr:NHLP leader peptide family RiPP precursor [Pyrinomonadaceae bacterium]